MTMQNISPPLDQHNSLIKHPQDVTQEIDSQKITSNTSVATGSLSLRSKLCRLGLDLLLLVPPILFLVYAGLVAHYNGQQANINLVSDLTSAAKYGPTVFPIAFAAVVGTFLMAVAAWRLEHGITMLSLEYLLSSRTVFSAITTPFNLLSINLAAPMLICLWALSPLGGQAAFRVIEIVPATQSTPWDFHYLDTMSPMLHCSPTSSAGADVMPPIVGAFTSALSSPGNIKNSSMDAFGNVKIPMFESCLDKSLVPDEDGWIDTSVSQDCEFAALTGIPLRGTIDANHTFRMETSYMYSDCTLSHSLNWTRGNWIGYLKNYTMFNNGMTMGVSTVGPNAAWRNQSQQLTFTSFTDMAATNATCFISQTYVETDMFCHGANCEVSRIRNSTKPHNGTWLSVLDLPLSKTACATPEFAFYAGLVKSTRTMTMYSESLELTDPYSSPLEYYLVNPDSPYAAAYGVSGWRGADIYPIGNKLFSQRLTQLLNTWYISNIAPFAVMGNFSGTDTSAMPGSNRNYMIQHVTGTMIPDVLQLRCHKGWLAVLVVASLVMLGASLATVIIGLLRTRPDILDRVSILVKDSPYVDLDYTSRQVRGEETARLKDVRLSLRHLPPKTSDYVPVGTTDVEDLHGGSQV